MSLPSLQEIDKHIERLEAELQKAREIRQGVALILGAASSAGSRAAEWIPFQEPLGARECLVRILQEAGQPLPWVEIQRRVAQLGCDYLVR